MSLFHPAAASSPPPRPNRSMAGMVAIVTGAGAAGTGIGNGRGAAVLLAEAGCAVVCADICLADAETTVNMIKADARRATAVPNPGFAEIAFGRGVAAQADVTNADDCKALVDLAVTKYGRLDVLVNNVGVVGAPGTALDVDPAEWARGLETNVTSMMLMAKHAIPAMLANKIVSDANASTDRVSGTRLWRGAIVNIGSVAGLRGGTPYLLYPTSKGAVINMTRALAVHHAEQGIRVNCVCPGSAYTPMARGGAEEWSQEKRDARKNRTLLKTEGTGWDAGAAVRFLASDEARWITGLIMPVDAGQTAGYN